MVIRLDSSHLVVHPSSKQGTNQESYWAYVGVQVDLQVG